MRRGLRLAVDIAAVLLLAGMTDLGAEQRLLAAVAVAVNALLLAGRAFATRPAQIGAAASLADTPGQSSRGWILMLGCGAERFNARCDAVVTPSIGVSLAIAFVSLPIGRLLGAMRVKKSFSR
jgi:hypothetical protein